MKWWNVALRVESTYALLHQGPEKIRMPTLVESSVPWQVIGKYCGNSSCSIHSPLFLTLTLAGKELKIQSISESRPEMREEVTSVVWPKRPWAQLLLPSLLPRLKKYFRREVIVLSESRVEGKKISGAAKSGTSDHGRIVTVGSNSC